MKLYTYFRSGASWRVRIGLHWKGVAYESVPMDLRTGAQSSAQWRRRNPQGLIPALELEDGTLLTQSLAILEWLDESYPERPFLPADPVGRARIRAVVLAIAADTHPLQNLGVLKRIEALTSADGARAWAEQTIRQGLAAVEALIARNPGPHAFGSQPTLADIFIVPQLFNARRFGVELSAFPRILEVEAATAALPAFAAAVPDRQPDADSG